MEPESLKTWGFLGLLVPSQRFIGSLLVFFVHLSVFVLSQLPHVVLEAKSLKTLGFLSFLGPSQRFIESLLSFLRPFSVFVLSQLPHIVPESENLEILGSTLFPIDELAGELEFVVSFSLFLRN